MTLRLRYSDRIREKNIESVSSAASDWCKRRSPAIERIPEQLVQASAQNMVLPMTLRNVIICLFVLAQTEQKLEDVIKSTIVEIREE